VQIDVSKADAKVQPFLFCASSFEKISEEN
jgi:hypothetical protein